MAAYVEEFNNRARYASDDVDTDAKRRERFLDDLNDELAIQLSVVYTPNYQSLLDKATILESKQKQAENRKRKFSYDKHYSGPSQRMRSVHDGSGGSGFHKHGGNGHHHGGSNNHNHGHNHHGGYRGNNHNGNGNHQGQHHHNL